MDKGKETGPGRLALLLAAMAAIAAVWHRHGPKVLVNRDVDTGAGAYRTGKSSYEMLEVHPLLWTASLLKKLGSLAAIPFVWLYNRITICLIVKSIGVLLGLAMIGFFIWLMSLCPCCGGDDCGRSSQDVPGLCGPEN